MEEEFEKTKKKHSKLKVFIIVLILLAVIGGIVATILILKNKESKEPDNIFKGAVEKMFEAGENEEITSSRVELNLSAELETTKNSTVDDVTVKQIDALLSAVKLKTVFEMDMNQKIFNLEVTPEYDGRDVVTADGLIQNNKIYVYLKDIFSKYIEIPVEDLDLEGFELEDIFNQAQQTIDKELINDIKEVLLNKIEESEFVTEEVEITLDGKDQKVQKSTLELSAKDVIDLSKEILEKVDSRAEGQVKDAIDEMIDELDSTDASESDVEIVIDLYTKGAKNSIVRFDLTGTSEEENMAVVMSGVKDNDNEFTFTVKVNEESSDVDDAEEILKVYMTGENDKEKTIGVVINGEELLTAEINEKNENEGTIKLVLNVEEVGIKATLNVEYKVENNVNIQKRNVSNSVSIEDLTDADTQEMLQNIQDNEVIMSIIELISSNYSSKSNVYGNDDDYNYGGSYYNDYVDDYDYNL